MWNEWIKGIGDEKGSYWYQQWKWIEMRWGEGGRGVIWSIFLHPHTPHKRIR